MVLYQYRHGPRRMCLAFPGGAVAAGESPLDAARRELLEETGCLSDHWSTYGHYVTNTNQYCNTAHLFRAERCRRVSDPTAPDLEQPELLVRPVSALLQPDVLPQFGSISHVALLLLAANPVNHAVPIS
jgi:ADP-ribose pyrophosphatase